MSDGEYSLYIVRCSDGSLYTGIAIDVAQRIQEHENAARGAKYLRGKGPLALVFSQPVGDRSRASRFEYQVKKSSKAQKLALIEGHRMLEDFCAVDQTSGSDCG